jgi:lipoprotein-anchoring transpeptidase ErfK/SrfK
MSKLMLAVAIWGGLAIAIPTQGVWAGSETIEARETASDAAAIAREDFAAAFGDKYLKPGQYVWRSSADATGEPRVVISLSEQLAYLYRGDTLTAAASISTGEPGRDTPTGIFTVLDKKEFHRSVKYDNAPMPHMQRIDQYGIALHAGHNPGHPASHGCIRLPAPFAAKLFGVTGIGTQVLIGA